MTLSESALLRIRIKNFPLPEEFAQFVHCVKSVLIWSYSGPYSVRLREIRTRIIPHKYTFHAERKDLANEIVVIWKQATLNTILLN